MAKKIIVLLLSPLLLFWHWFEPAAKKNRQGIRAYEEKKYDQALQRFLAAKGVKPDSAALMNNTAAALYELKKFQQALEEFSKVAAAKKPPPQADLHYNMGNASYRLEQWDQSLDFYRKCLLAHPDDMDAKRNFELALKKKRNQNQQQPQQQPQASPKPSPLLQYLNQNELKQMEKNRRPSQKQNREKDW